MTGRTRSFLLALLALAGADPSAWAACSLVRRGELPVIMNGLRPVVHARINGADAPFLADSGAFYSMITPAAAERYKLPLRYSPLDIRGVGGIDARTYLTRVSTLTLLNIAVPNVDFFVSGNDLGDGTVGLLGQNVLRVAGDVEYDLANGVIRLMTSKDCKDTSLAYWANAEGKPYTVIDIASANAREPHTKGDVYVNGVRMRATFDTGAATSVLTRAAAARAGVTPESPGAVAAGESFGIGQKVAHSWIAPFASFKIGDEEIRNTRLRFAEISIDTDMLVGADFFLSHRVYVATGQRKLYLTYNGGPVFNLNAVPASASAAPPARPPPQSGAPLQAGTPSTAGAPPGTSQPAQPGDAEGFARRAEAAMARHDFDDAITELTRAIELAPGDANYPYARGVAHWNKKQLDEALTDLDASVKLNPGAAPARLARAGVRTARHEPLAGILEDLEAADRALARDDATHLQIGEMYVANRQYAAAVAQFSKWIDSHDRFEVHLADVLSKRCQARALGNLELDRALDDCTRAVKLRPNTASFLDTRGLVRLRQYDYDKAIADYDAALKLQPREAWALYGRGLARLGKGQTTLGQADIAAARVIRPDIADVAAKHGLSP
jgi:tetratricopeptide (TPR) repeat protein/predicted aspartyl protease